MADWLKILKDLIRQRGGAVIIAQVDSVSGNSFTAAELIGWGDDAFHGWMVYVFQSDNAAPEGEFRGVTDFVDSTGTVSYNAFTAALAAGDWVMLISPSVDAARQSRGGAQTIQDVIDNQAALLDLGYGEAEQVVCDGNEQTLYEHVADGSIFFFAGGFIDWTGANSNAGEDTTVKVYVKTDGTNYRYVYSETFLAAAVPDPALTPFPRDVNTRPTPEGFYTKQSVKVTVQQAAEGGGWNTLDYNIIDAARGS